MKAVMYTAYVEYSDGVIGFLGDDYDSAEDAEKAARERLSGEVTSGYIESEHGGVELLMIRESKEVKRAEL